MDIHKLEVDETQINKATGRIILPESDLPKSARSPRPQAAAPRLVPQASSPGLASPAQDTLLPQPAASATPPWLFATLWGASSLLVALAILALLMWSSGQLRQSMEALRSESMRQQAISERVAQNLTSFSKDISTLRTVVSELRAENLRLSAELRQIKQQLTTTNTGTPSSPAAAIPVLSQPATPSLAAPAPPE